MRSVYTRLTEKRLFWGLSAALALAALSFLFVVAPRTGDMFPRSTRGLPEAQEPALIRLQDGDTYELTASYVVKEIGNRRIRMIAYNGSVPGPFVSAPQGATVTMRFTNELDIETTVHSHGLRLDYLSDGTPGLSQVPVKPGETFVYTLSFPDAGVYWYHPHVREDYAQELGMYGNYLIEPVKYALSPVNESVPLIIDDILFDGEDIEPFYTDRTNFAIMGRFGDVMLVNGVPDYSRSFTSGDVVRFDITNVANARPFELSIPGATMKLVGSDLSPYERETFVENILITPSERYIVDVYFPEAGEYVLRHTSHDRTLGVMHYDMATFAVSPGARESHRAEFETLRTYPWVNEEAALFSELLFKKPEKSLRITLDPGSVDFGDWMQDLPCHRMPDGEWMGACTDAKKEAWLAGLSEEERTLGGEKIHWEDHTFAVNRVTTNRDITWQLVDQATGKANEKIDDWKFQTGDIIKLRIFNDPVSAHPMQHPFHVHGQRIMTLSINGTEVENKVWKDTILIPVGDTYDIIVEFSNPGLWMAHCHIAEHLSAGMMFTFAVGKEHFDAYDAIVAKGTHEGHGH